MSGLKRIAVDAMGGDFGPSVAVPAALRSLKQHPGLSLILVGEQDQLEPELERAGATDPERLEIVHARRVSAENSTPAGVLRRGQDCSLYRAVELVQSGEADACVSAGDTGALLLVGRHLLKTVPGIDRPAIIARIPAADRRSYLLDVGANVDSDANHLFQFAVMGSVLCQSVDGLASPRVGLLNIGEEAYKGTAQVRAAARLLEQATSLNYIGYVEGNELFTGEADVIVCDGFAGNVTIKTSAGVVRVIEDLLRQQISCGWLSRLLGPVAAAILRPLRQHIDPARFNGASLLGLQGIVIKSHGNATVEAFTCAIEQACREVENNVPRLIADRVAALLGAQGT